jgi:hypothetical protein
VNLTNPVMVAYGAGTNSTAMLVGMAERGERPDLIIFADTGGELPATYAYLPIMDAWLKSVGFPEIVIVHRARTDGLYGLGLVADAGVESLEENCLAHGTLPSAAYGMPTCSVEWKRRPQERYVRRWTPAVDAWASGAHIVKCLGFDADEEYRKARVPDDKRVKHRYPLIEFGWDRDDCVAAIARAGLPKCVGSSCFFCPNRSPVPLSKRHPEHFARAVAIEVGMAERDKANSVRTSIRGLGRTRTWPEMVENAGRQVGLFNEMPCGCYDGNDE